MIPPHWSTVPAEGEGRGPELTCGILDLLHQIIRVQTVSHPELDRIQLVPNGLVLFGDLIMNSHCCPHTIFLAEWI